MIYAGVFRDEQETERLLLTKQEGDCSFVAAGTGSGFVTGTVLRVQGGAVVREAVADVPYAHYLNDESVDGQTSLAWETVRAYPELAMYAEAGYALRPLRPGTSGEFGVGDAHFLFCGSRKGKRNVYFDLTVFSGDDAAWFNNPRGVPWMTHSGDRNATVAGKSYLMHSLSLSGLSGLSGRSGLSGGFAEVCAVGYLRKKLREFAEYSPFIALADGDSRTLWLVPFSLSEASVGDSTLIAPVFIAVARGRLRYIVPEKPDQQPNFDTGMYTAELRRMVADAAASFDARHGRLLGAGPLRVAAEAAAVVPTQESALYQAACRATLIVVLQDGLDAPDAPWDGTTCLCRLGTTLTVTVPTSRPGRAPPSAYYAPVFGDGVACGAQPSLFLCARSPSGLTTEQWQRLAERTPALVYVSARGGIRESDVGASAVHVNGVMVIVDDGPELGDEERERHMHGLSVPATRLMGAQSVVLYSRGGVHRFYRGVPALWSGLPRGPLAFAAPVAFSPRTPVALACGVPYTVAQTDRTVVLRGEAARPADVLAAVRAIESHEELDALRPELALAFAQLGVLLDAPEMRDMKAAMLALCHAYVDSLIAPIRQQRRDALASMLGDGDCDAPRVARLLATLKCAEREARRTVQELANDVEAMCSVREASSKGASSIQSSQRGALIAGRVAKAESLDVGQFAVLLANVPFYAIAEATDALPALLRAAASEPALEAWLVSQGGAALRLSERCHMLDGDTVAAVLESKLQLAHMLSSDDPGSTAFAMHGAGGVRSHLPLPVTDAALAWEGGCADWMTLANEESSQLMRIRLRRELARVRGLELDVASPRLTVALVAMLLALAQGMRGRGDAERDDTRQQLLRGVVYLMLCTSASGKEPSLYVHQLTQPHADLKLPPTPGHWLLYAGVLEALCSLAAPPASRDEVRHAACALLARALRKGCADPITAPLRAEVRSAKLQGAAASAGARDEALQWARACMLLFQCLFAQRRPEAVEAGEAGEAVEAVEAVVEEWPDEPCFAALPAVARDWPTAAASLLLAAPERRRMHEYKRALRALVAGSAPDEGQVRVASARYFTRHSGAFAESKRAALAASDAGGLELRRALVARFLGVEVAHVVPSNHAAFVRLDVAAMRGDCELARLARPAPADWCGRPARGYEPLSVGPGALWHELLGEAEFGEARGATGRGAVDSAEATATRALVGVSSMLTLDAVIARASLPLAPVARMFAALGLDAEDAREVVRICLRKWNDVNGADMAAVAYLRGRNGVGE